MGKTLDQLGDLSQPVGDPHLDPLKIRADRAFRFIQHCKALELDPRVAFAYDTIAGIRATVEITGEVSEGQERAIRNIAVGAERRRSGQEDRQRKWGRGEGRYPARRYEGWGR